MFRIHITQHESQRRMVLANVQTYMPCWCLQAIGFQLRRLLSHKSLDFDVMQALEHGPDLLIIGFGTHRGGETPGILRLALQDHGSLSATRELHVLHLSWREGQYRFITQGVE